MTDPILSVGPASRRNTKAYFASFLGVNVLFSYITPVVVAGYDENGNFVQYKRKNVWGPTTGRHINEWTCGVYEVIDDGDVFNEKLNHLLLCAVANAVKERTYERNTQDRQGQDAYPA